MRDIEQSTRSGLKCRRVCECNAHIAALTYKSGHGGTQEVVYRAFVAYGLIAARQMATAIVPEMCGYAYLPVPVCVYI